MFNEEKNKIFVKDDDGHNAFALYHEDKGLIAEFKTKGRDKNQPAYVYIEAIEVIDQIAAAMNQEERMVAYAKLAKRLGITE